MEQSYLTISDEEAQALILKYAGTGVSSDKTNGEVTSEFVTVGEDSGEENKETNNTTTDDASPKLKMY